MCVVLAQPHRRGNRSQNRSTALGRFVEDNGLRPEFIRAGEFYGSLRKKYDAAIGAPMPDRHGGSGADIPMETVHRWRDQLFSLELAMIGAGVAALGNVEWLAVKDLDLPKNCNKNEAKQGLLVLSIELGMLGARDLAKTG
jgi:hypothetical protein